MRKAFNLKKILSVLTVIAIIISAIAVFPTAAFAANDKTIDNDSNGNIFSGAGAGSSAVKADFSVRSGAPLFKKLSLLNPSNTTLQATQAYGSMAEELRPNSIRMSNSIFGDDGTDAYYNTYAANLYNQYGAPFADFADIYMHAGGVQSAIDSSKVGSDTDNWYLYAPLMTPYKNAFQKTAAYYKNANKKVIWEIGNEPDYSPMWKGTFAEYIDIYTATSKAIRQGNPDATIGGLSAANVTALGTSNLNSFLSNVIIEQAPIDYVSFHDYEGKYGEYITKLRAALDADATSKEYFRTTGLHLNEFNVWKPWASSNNDLTKSSMVPDIFSAMLNLSTYTDVSEVMWASILASPDQMELISSAGKRYASFNALKIFQNMPVERVSLATSGLTALSIKGFAAKEDYRTGTVLWNESSFSSSFTVNLSNIPFDNATINVYRIDNNNASFGNGAYENLTVLEKMENVSGRNAYWTGSIPSKGALYIEITDGSQRSELTEYSDIGTVVKTEYDYETRGRGYQYYDEKTAVAYLGLTENWLRPSVAVTVDNPKAKLHVSTELTGNLRALDTNSAVGIRVDYRGTNGQYIYSDFYTNNICSPNKLWGTPFGTKLNADRILYQSNFAGFDLDILGNAPAGWDGTRVQIIFEMQNTGANTEAKFKLSSPFESQNLETWYTFDNDSEGVVVDQSGNGHSAKIFGNPTYSPSTGAKGVGKSINFDGTNAILMDNRDFLLGDGSGFSISMRFKVAPSGVDNHMRLLSNGSWGDGTPGITLLIWPSSDGWARIDYAVGDYTGPGIWKTDGAAIWPFEVNTWYDLIVSYDLVSQTINVYSDYMGGLANLVSYSFANDQVDFLSDFKYLSIGGRCLGSAVEAGFKGSIDDFAVFNKALSEQEATAIFNHEVLNSANATQWSEQEPNLKFWYDFNNDSDGNVYDKSGNGKDGIAVGTVNYVPGANGGYAAKLDTTGFVKMATSNLNPGGSNVTVFTRLKMPANYDWGNWAPGRSENMRIISTGVTGPNTPGYFFGPRAPYGWGGQHIFFGMDTEFIYPDSDAWFSAPANDVWYTVAASYDQFNKIVKIYVDGVLKEYYHYVGKYDLNSLQQYTAIGGRYEPDTDTIIEQFDGIVDDVMCFEGSLTTAQIAALSTGNLNNTFTSATYDTEDFAVAPGTTAAAVTNSFTASTGTVALLEADGTAASGNAKTGQQIVYTLNGMKLVTAPLHVLGDISGDGLVETNDLVLIKKYTVDAIVLDGAYKKAADQNQSGTITPQDIVDMKKFMLGVS